MGSLRLIESLVVGDGQRGQLLGGLDWRPLVTLASSFSHRDEVDCKLAVAPTGWVDVGGSLIKSRLGQAFCFKLNVNK